MGVDSFLDINFFLLFGQAAKAAKTVKYGSNVDGISTCDPEQYGKRFIEFVAKAIEGNQVTPRLYIMLLLVRTEKYNSWDC